MSVLVISQGEPAGIAPEIIAAAWRQARNRSDCPFVVIGDAKLLEGRGQIPTQKINNIAETTAIFSDALPVIDVPLATPVTPGTPNPENAAQVIACIDRCVALCHQGEALGMITAPIDKAVLQQAGFAHKGHTDYLGALDSKYLGTPSTVVMMLAAETFRCVPITVHQSLASAISSLSIERILSTLGVVRYALQQQFSIPKPRIALSGLNPHAGENGLMGDEEQTLIIPAIHTFQQQYDDVEVQGPFPADTLFIPEIRSHFDAILAMYHDQALIPIKTLFFDQAVNISLGLSFVRTSPDHGTAYDLAGTMKASSQSMIAAIKMARSMQSCAQA